MSGRGSSRSPPASMTLTMIGTINASCAVRAPVTVMSASELVVVRVLRECAARPKPRASAEIPPKSPHAPQPSLQTLVMVLLRMLRRINLNSDVVLSPSCRTCP